MECRVDVLPGPRPTAIHGIVGVQGGTEAGESHSDVADSARAYQSGSRQVGIGGLGEQITVSGAKGAGSDPGGERVANRRRRPLKVLDEAPDRLVGAGQPGGAQRGLGVLGDHRVLGSDDGREVGRAGRVAYKGLELGSEQAGAA